MWQLSVGFLYGGDLMKEKEIRSMQTEINSQEEMVVEGYAVVFEEPTVLFKVNGVEYKEVIDKRAFNNTIFKDCCLKYNHSNSVPILARTRGGSLELSVDDKGLFFRAKLFDTQAARDVYKLVKEGALDKCSFAFLVADNGDEYDRSTRTRRITNIERLFDISIVDTPAYEQTSVYARSYFLAEVEKETLDREKRRRELLLRTYE